MSNKKERMKTSKLSSTVLDYYYKYGQNRDLEKYLRMKRQSTSKSSSDSSLRNFESSHHASDSKRITKSMEKLHLSANKSDDTDATKSANNSKEKKSPERMPTDPKPIKIEKKTHHQQHGKSKSKSYNWNCESSIEINLPSSSSLPAELQVHEPTPSARILQLESAETQTDTFLPQAAPVAVHRKPPVAPRTLPAKATTEPAPSVPDNMPDTSPASSVASATKVRLEWDSMADIGYNRIIDFKSQSNTNLSSFEKSALTKFFAKRGLNFDENLVILAPAESNSPLHKREFTQSAIEMRDAQRMRKEAHNLSPASNKRLWEKALQKYRDKYGKCESTSAVDTTQFMSISMAPHHSTPLTFQASNNDSSLNDESSFKPTIDSIPESPKVKRKENWCQTSSIDMEAIGVQVEQPKVNQASKSVQIQIEQRDESTQKDDENITTATSFEFLAPDQYVSEQPTIDDIPHRDDTRNAIVYAQQENPDDKENIPPIEDKENIPPPPPMHSTHPNDQPGTYKTPENTVTEGFNESSVLPIDLAKGVELINALIDSRTTDSSVKKKFIRKIVRHLLKKKDTKDITQMILSYSEKSSTKVSGVCSLADLDSDASVVKKTEQGTISGVSVLSESSTSDGQANEPLPAYNAMQPGVGPSNLSPTNNVGPQEEVVADNDEQIVKEVKEWLLPLTQSEIEKENARKSRITQSEAIQHEAIEPVQPRRQSTNDKKDIPQVRAERDKPTKGHEILAFLENEKKTHFNWIDQEIEHLNNLKMLLQNVNESVSNDSKGNVSDEKINSVYAKHNRDYWTIYENFRRTGKNVSNRNGSQADVSSTLIDSSKSSSSSSRYLTHDKISRSHWIHKTTLESPPSTISSGSKVHGRAWAKCPVKSNGVKLLKDESKLAEWDSHLNMQQLVKNRTKMKTPNSDESIEAYAKACRENFNRKCGKKQNDFSKAKDGDQPIYTKPYSSDSYSDVPHMKRAMEQRLKGASRKQSTPAAYTSVSESDGFLSPNSISIGVAANSTSNTTTHQYDTKISVGLQTTGTLQRMPIIQIKKPTELPPPAPAESRQSTVRVNKFTLNKQLQVRPESLAYVIMFKDVSSKDENGNSRKESRHERNNKFYVNADNAIAAHTNPGGPKRRQPKHSPTDTSSTSSAVSVDNLTLQECLQARRPDFYANAEQRRKCLNDLHNLRQQRNEQRKKLFAMNICTNAKTLNRNMKRLLPPPPLAQMRIFKSREIVSRTRRKYQKLPEILKRQQTERDMKIRRNHRILVNMFSKNLQKHVLSGKTDLSNSMMIN